MQKVYVVVERIETKDGGEKIYSFEKIKRIYSKLARAIKFVAAKLNYSRLDQVELGCYNGSELPFNDNEKYSYLIEEHILE